MHDAQIRVAIAGAGGRMGRQLIQAALQMEGVALGAALEREGSSGGQRRRRAGGRRQSGRRGAEQRRR